MIPTSVLAKMASLGLSEDQAETVAAMLSAVESATREEVTAVVDKSREKARARLQRWREKNGNVSKRSDTSRNDSRAGDARVEDNLLTKNQSGQKERKQENAPAALREFDAFWDIYPKKAGKREAEKAFAKALSRASFDAIMAGARRYAAERIGQDAAHTKHAQGWLNGDRWEDEPTPRSTPQRSATGPPSRRETPFDALADISRLKGWTSEPGILPGDNENAERVSAVGDRHSGPVVDLRRGHDWHS